MITKDHPLLHLLKLVDEVWQPIAAVVNRRGAPYQYSEQSMFKINLVDVLKQPWSHRSVWRVLTRMPAVRAACGLQSVPDRRTLDRRLGKLSGQLEAQIDALGLTLMLEEITDGTSAAGDGSVIAAWKPTDQKVCLLATQVARYR